jgi:hypothetical protein
LKARISSIRSNSRAKERLNEAFAPVSLRRSASANQSAPTPSTFSYISQNGCQAVERASMHALARFHRETQISQRFREQAVTLSL